MARWARPGFTGRATAGEPPPGRSARRRAVSALLAVALGASGCAVFGMQPPTRPALTLERHPAEVIGHADAVDLALVNRGPRALRVAWPPGPYLVVRAAMDTGRPAVACSAPPSPPEAITAVELQPREELPVRVDLLQRCRVTRGQDFTAELWYEVPPSIQQHRGGRGVWVGASAAQRLEVAPSRAAAEVPSGVPPLGPNPAR